MKKLLVFLFAAVAAGVVLSVRATEAQWTFDGSTLTDGDWTFNASVNGTELTVNAVQSDPGEGATLDFSKPITDGYVIVKLNPNFGAYANKANLATLVLPTEGLTTISADAFKSCTSLTSITPFLPDCVTTINGSAFESVPIEGELSLKGIVKILGKAFKQTSVSKVVFGSALKTLTGGWTSGCFDSCKKLETVDFDPSGSGAEFNGEGVFASCSKLSGTIDLRGFKTLGNRPFYQSYCPLNKMLISSTGVTSVVNSFFHSANSIKQIVFDGGVPSCMSQLITAYNDGSHTWSNVYTIVPEDKKDEWAEYCENKTINKANSYFDPALVTKAKTANCYLIYQGAGSGGEKGYWVFDGTTLASTNGLWEFAATPVGVIGVSVGACLSYPDEPAELDFSKSVTDPDGTEMALSTYVKCFHDGTNPIAGNDKVISVKIASESTSIGNSAFRGCTSIAGTVVIPDQISVLDSYCFYGCTGITKLELGKGVANIADHAFHGCTSLTEIEPCLPDTVTTLGGCAFQQCPMSPDCVMNGIVTIGSSAIRETAVKSIYLGPGLKTLYGGYQNGSISYNAELTTITFDAGITNASLPQEHALCYNYKLSGTIDLSGFSSISGGRPLDQAKITNLIFCAKLASIPGGVLEGLSRLQTVYFLGPPPTNVGLIFDQQGRNDRIGKNQDVRTYVYRAYEDQWKVYAKDEILNGKHSTWSPDYLADEVTDLSKRKLLLVDPAPGLMLIIK